MSTITFEMVLLSQSLKLSNFVITSVTLLLLMYNWPSFGIFGMEYNVDCPQLSCSSIQMLQMIHVAYDNVAIIITFTLIIIIIMINIITTNIFSFLLSYHCYYSHYYQSLLDWCNAKKDIILIKLN